MDEDLRQGIDIHGYLTSQQLLWMKGLKGCPPMLLLPRIDSIMFRMALLMDGLTGAAG